MKNQNTINQIKGELITREKYRFVDELVISSVVDDVFEIMTQEDATTYSYEDFEQASSRINTRVQASRIEAKEQVAKEYKIEALRMREIAGFGNKQAVFELRNGNSTKAAMWRKWAYYKELEAEYFESQI